MHLNGASLNSSAGRSSERMACRYMPSQATINLRGEEIFLLYRQRPQMLWHSTESSIGGKGPSDVGSIFLLEGAT